MKFTLSWLKDHLETDASLNEILEKLNMIGLEVEEVVNPAEKLGAFKIAKVLHAEQHPNADRLRVLKVDTGEGDPLQVVCGAPNARTGLVGVFAKPGDYVPGLDVTLSVGKIRDVESFGMMASERELELSDEHDGVIDLPDDAPVGMPYVEYAGLDDPVIEIGLTPNRPDCASVYGIARDLAAAGLGTLKAPKAPAFAPTGPNPIGLTLELGDNPEHCPAFGLRLVKGVKNGPSPKWLQKRLSDIGLRPINTLVDITNYMTFDQGRPLHVFDADKVHGDLVVTHYDGDGEDYAGLDGKTYALESGTVVISDDNGVESLGGILGGEQSGCTNETVNVLIESALWDPLMIARTGRKLNVVSDARYRFERGVDPNYMAEGLDAATQMVIDLCGGEATEATLAGDVPSNELVINFPFAEVKRLSGLDVSSDEIKGILSALGFVISGEGESVQVTPPSWRPDVHGKADLVEEVVRIIGLDNVPAETLPRMSPVSEKVLTVSQNRRSSARRTLATRGMDEAVTWSFISKRQAEIFDGGGKELELANPISADMSDMRPSLLPGLLTAAQRNADRGYPDVALFEVGQVFTDDTEKGQKMVVAGIRRGTASMGGAGRHWSGNSEAVNVFDAKADAEAALSAIGAPTEKLMVFTDAPSYYHPGRSGALKLGPKNTLALFGEIHPKTLEELDLEGPLVGFEVFIDAPPAPKKKATRSKGALNAADLMPVRRDFAFLVDADVPAEKLLRAARGADKNLIKDVTLFDIYEGQGVPEGQRSLAIDVMLQPVKKTLTDEDIEAVSAKIVAAVAKTTGGTLRG
ncbi:phenylalanine--tRNA ligase subunit beta [Flexibacterium corallicola]|uniref:phenylalanine--tRNA ligase subunit beta n=1 Tax=Flexibacterium corallicola TaxID=3037259 RepID=UPI00286FA726|nr:phenylalanine--tRNA ligase subunit beta [Pseudovibrio sp. M1P-2-3]